MVLSALALLSTLTPLAQAADAANTAVTAGTGTVATSGATTTITQTSQRLAIDWTKLSTAANEALVFAQPNAQAVALNRITGSSPSSLLGSLSANGQVFILNPNGVLFGAGSSVNVGGLVASTLSMSNTDFMAGRNVFTNSAGSGASVVNRGALTAANGGYIALLAPEVRNDGAIIATFGTALLAAGKKVTLSLNNGSLLGYSIDEGAIKALVDNKQLIQADGGQVILSAKAFDALASATVNNTGVIEARTLQSKAGRILLVGDIAVGTVNVAGTLNASAPNTDGQGGNGGFVETSAAHVRVNDSAVVTTLAAHSGAGKSGTWLIDPTDYTIAAADPANGSSYMSNTALGSNLGNNNIIIQTLATGTGNGDIFVNDAVSWTSGHSLTLNAVRDVNVNAVISSSSSGNNALGGNVSIAAGRDISLSVAGTVIDTSVSAGGGGTSTRQGGDITLTAGGKIAGINSSLNSSVTKFQSGSTGARGGNITLTANGGDVTIDGMFTSTFQNDTGGVIGNGGNVNVTASGAITVGTIITTASGAIYDYGNATTMGNGGNVSLIAMSGSVVVNGAIDASVTRNNATGGDGGSVVLRADGNGACLSNSEACSTVTFGANGLAMTTDTGRVDIYYNPVSYTADNPYTTNLSGTSTVWMLVNDLGVTSGGLRGLQAVAKNLPGNYALGTNIDAAATANWNGGAGFAPIGSNAAAFTGTFDGLGHIISSLNINQPTLNNVGLFGLTATSATVQNVALINANVIGSSGVGVLVGSNNGTISNSSSTGNVTGVTNGHDIGGLVGYNLGTISGSSAAVDVTVAGNAGYSIGGLAGYNEGVITGSKASGNVSASANKYIGGLVGTDRGSFTSSMISDSFSTGLVAGGTYVGGLIGWIDGAAKVNNSYATGNVSGNIDTGGLLGHIDGGTIRNSYATGSVTGIDVPGSSSISTGGLVGYNNGMVSDSYATGSVTAPRFVGGLVGFNDLSIGNSYASGRVTGEADVGGLVGSGRNGSGSSSVSNSYWNTVSSGQTSSYGGNGLNAAQMQTVSSFSGWSISSAGGSGQIWRNYEGQTAPLLTSFLGKLTLSDTTAIYNGTSQNGAGASTSTVFGTSGRNAGVYNAYSNQQGYDITGGKLTIDKAALTIGVTGINKTYDGSAAATVGYNDNRIAGDNLAFTSSASFADKNAAIDKAVTANGIVVSGTDSANYAANTVASTTATINKAVLTVGVTGIDKVYDGSAAAAVRYTDNRIANDNLTFTGSASFADKNAGTGKAVTASGIAVGGTDSANYAANTVASTTAAISKAALTIGVTGINKTYDGSAAATVGYNDNRIAGDNLAFTSSASFADKNAAIDKAVTANGIVVSGTDSANYAANTVASTTATISKAALTVTANSASRLADGTAYSGGNGVVYSGFVAGETTAALGGVLSYAGSAQGASAAGRYAIAPTGLSANNYTLAYLDGALTLKPANAAETALGGPELVTAYVSTLKNVSETSSVVNFASNTDRASTARTSSPLVQTDSRLSSEFGVSQTNLVNCGVAMPAGFETNTCR